ncbi:hypothetical protein H1R20_g11195, partial [Candolleomyces eurysporus]
MPRTPVPRASIEKSEAHSRQGHPRDRLTDRRIQQRTALVPSNENLRPELSARAERCRKRELVRKMATVKADPAEDPQLPQRPDPQIGLRLQSLEQKKARLEKKVEKLRRNTLDLWSMADGYHAQLHDALAVRNLSINEMRTAEERAERGKLAERALQEERDGLYEELRLLEEKVAKAEEIDLTEKLRQAEERAEQANLSWKRERAKLQEELGAAKEKLAAEPADLLERLRQAEERAERIDMEWQVERAGLQKELREAEKRVDDLETTDMAKKLQEAEEGTRLEHSRAMKFWLALSKERRETELLREALENGGEYPTGVAQGPGILDPLL